ncbi:exopolysaccharide Pel transporter PelG [Marivita sp. S0852]|uniref:exopolysaccharide Pel transporter PelG n=1 Tax=Marivita sp. S0852 TaxID=3373893 RepID=UPI0039827886
MSSNPSLRLKLQAVLRQVDWWLDGPILSPLRSLIAALVLAAGPWLLVIVTLILISWIAENRFPDEALEDMRLAVVYAFMLAPIVAAPVGIIAARTVADAEMPLEPSAIGALLLVACGVAGLTAEALVLIVVLVLGLSNPSLTLAFALLTSISAMMWVAFAVLAACKARRRLILSFSTGLIIALGLSVAVANHAGDASVLVWCFTTGIALCLALCLEPFLQTGHQLAKLREAGVQLRICARKTWPLAVGASLAIMGIWADKWVVWFGSGGQSSVAGFRHMPTYDSALFLAQLSALPGLASLAIYFEEPVRRAMDRFWAKLSNGVTLRAAKSSGRAVSEMIWTGVFRIMMTQFAVSAALLLLAPAIASAMGLRLDQFLILRMGIVGTLLHALFLAASGILVLCNAKMAFLVVQAAFLVANFSLSAILTSVIGVNALGFALASGLVSMIACLVAFETTKKIVGHLFLFGNDSI